MGAYLGKTSGLIAKLAGIDKIKKVFCMVTKGLLLSTSLMGVFDLLTMAMKHFHLDNVFTRWNESLHSHKDYNVFQFTITALTSFMTGIGRGYRANVCFIAGTMVMTAAGLMAIEQIKAGDLVLTTSPDTYETVYKKVAETYERETKDLLHLQITGAGRTDRIVTTPNHPFYVAGKGFVKAGDLREGDELCASSSIEKVTIEKILPEVAKEPVKVYNLQVEDFHTYHVGALGVWVHNCTPEVKEEAEINPQSPMFGDDWHRYFNEKYGANNVTWESATIDDIIDMPSRVVNFSPEQVANLAQKAGWSVEPLGKGSLKGIPFELGGGMSMRAPNGSSLYIQYHPGGGHHGDMPYFKISSGSNGTRRFYINELEVNK